MVIPAYEIAVLEFTEFLQDMKDNALNYGSYVWPSYYADDYTQEEITFAQHQFYNLVSAYLKCTDRAEYRVKLYSNGVEVMKFTEK